MAKLQRQMSQFECLQCGNCCRQDGYVRLRSDEPDTIAAFLKMDVALFIEKYTILTRDRQALSLIDCEDNACIFLSEKGCRINPVKPAQCSSFPQKWKFNNFKGICNWAKAQDSGGMD